MDRTNYSLNDIFLCYIILLMNGRRITQKEINKIVRLRKTGHSLNEIRKIVERGSSTVVQYTKNVEVLPQYKESLKIKQGGSKFRSLKQWRKAEILADKITGKNISRKERILIAACLYWGEGTKRDFSISNTDPDLLKSFIICLKEMGVKKDELKVTVRIYEDLNRNSAVAYWAGIVGIPKKQILNVNVLRGKKSGKLKYGMCRVRIKKGGGYLKILQSLIKAIKIKLNASPCSSMDRTAHS